MSNLFEASVSDSEIKNCTNFPEAIKVLCKSRGWTKTELAERMGYSLKHLSEVVNDTQYITVIFARRLEEVTGIDKLFWLELYFGTYLR